MYRKMRVINDTPPIYDNHQVSISNNHNTVFNISQDAINIGMILSIYKKLLYRALLFKFSATAIICAVLYASFWNVGFSGRAFTLRFCHVS